MKHLCSHIHIYYNWILTLQNIYKVYIFSFSISDIFIKVISESDDDDNATQNNVIVVKAEVPVESESYKSY